MTTETEELLWIAAQDYRTIPKDIVKFAVNNGKTLYELLDLEKSEFHNVEKKLIEKFFSEKESIPFPAIQRIYDHMYKESIEMITYTDQLFPSGLKKLETKDVPVMLYHQGKKMKYENCIAIVGTRNCSTRAVEYAREISQNLVKFGYIIVSGLARGIDAAAHRGAISVGGKTVAVLPWIFEPYPPEHGKLLEEIKSTGSVVSDNFFKPPSHWNKYKFLERNAIISGMSEVIIAVESSFSGGTRWQVELALSQKKKVIAMEPDKENKLAYEGFEKFVEKGAIRGSTSQDAIDLIRKEVKIKDHALDEYDFEEVEVKPLLKK